jgi:hypothetical protein
MSVPAVLRATHWTFAALFAAFVVSGIAIVIAHPRFYWAESGFFDLPAAFGLPIATIKGHTSWGRNLHFLAVWLAVVNAAACVAWACGAATSDRACGRDHGCKGSPVSRVASEFVPATKATPFESE